MNVAIYHLQHMKKLIAQDQPEKATAQQLVSDTSSPEMSMIQWTVDEHIPCIPISPLVIKRIQHKRLLEQQEHKFRAQEAEIHVRNDLVLLRKYMESLGLHKERIDALDEKVELVEKQTSLASCFDPNEFAYQLHLISRKLWSQVENVEYHVRHCLIDANDDALQRIADFERYIERMVMADIALFMFNDPNALLHGLSTEILFFTQVAKHLHMNLHNDSIAKSILRAIVSKELHPLRDKCRMGEDKQGELKRLTDLISISDDDVTIKKRIHQETRGKVNECDVWYFPRITAVMRRMRQLGQQYMEEDGELSAAGERQVKGMIDELKQCMKDNDAYDERLEQDEDMQHWILTRVYLSKRDVDRIVMTQCTL